MADLLVIGTGLIGTSVGLALRGSRDVVLADRDSAALSRAAARGAGRVWDQREPVELALVCVDVAATARVLAEVQRRAVAEHLSHVASTQADVQHALETSGADVTSVCGGHPMSGRETAGPDAASADLFEGRAWAVCPGPATRPGTRRAVDALARGCGAEPVVLSPQEHDEAVALVSHLPQVAASALAAQLLRRPAATRLAGPGLADTTRIAASPPGLWVHVLPANASRVGPLLRALAHDLLAVAEALQPAEPGTPSLAPVRDLLERGNAGRALVPLKRGYADLDFRTVTVDVPDRPGQLAGLFTSAARAQVNVEDVRVDHLPGRPRGRIELSVAAGDQDRLAAALAADGFEISG